MENIFGIYKKYWALLELSIEIMDEKRDYSEIQDNQKTKVQDFYA